MSLLDVYVCITYSLTEKQLVASLRFDYVVIDRDLRDHYVPPGIHNRYYHYCCFIALTNGVTYLFLYSDRLMHKSIYEGAKCL